MANWWETNVSGPLTNWWEENIWERDKPFKMTGEWWKDLKDLWAKPPEAEPVPTVEDLVSEQGAIPEVTPTYSDKELQTAAGEAQSYSAPDMRTWLWEQLPLANDPSRGIVDNYYWRVTPDGKVVNFNNFTTGMAMPDPTGTEAYTNLQGLTEELRGGPTEEDILSAETQRNRALAGMYGFESVGEYQTAQRQLQQEVFGGEAAMAGLTDEQREAYEDLGRSLARDAEMQARRLLEGAAAGGASLGARITMSEEAAQNIRNARVQAQVMMLERDEEARQRQLEQKTNLYIDMANKGQITYEQALNRIQEGKAQALMGYAQQLETIRAQNATTLDLYRADLEAITVNADLAYKNWNEMLVSNRMDLEEWDREYTAWMDEAQMRIDAVTAANEQAVLDYTMKFTMEDLLNTVFEAWGLAIQTAFLAGGG